MPAASPLVAALLSGLAVAGDASLLFRLQDPALLESSGLAASVRHPGIVWTHADGGEVAQVRAVDRAGRTVAVVTLAGIDPYDPEALAVSDGPDGPELWLGDIGDNDAARTDVSVFRFAEPRRLRDQTVTARWYRFAYPDGPHDAEAVLVEPGTRRVFIATKELGGGGLYRAPSELVTENEGTNGLRRVADAPVLTTDGAFLPGGDYLLRTYSTVHRFRPDGTEVAVESLPAQPLGESLAVDGDRLLVGSEGERSAVYAVPVPQPPAPTPGPARSPDGRRIGPGGPDSSGAAAAALGVTGWAALGGVAAALAAATLALPPLRRRRRR